MKKLSLFSTAIAASFMLQSCELVEGIFKAGMWWAFFSGSLGSHWFVLVITQKVTVPKKIWQAFCIHLHRE
ncbi:hypothetical protein LWM68_05025 [Niabella sp. W65]|nr:hypothetical protein [Niabella sp. W65]MCH7362188.1 hypothetical protein [Niabella sp. W65]